MPGRFGTRYRRVARSGRARRRRCSRGRRRPCSGPRRRNSRTRTRIFRRFGPRRYVAAYARRVGGRQAPPCPRRAVVGGCHSCLLRTSCRSSRRRDGAPTACWIRWTRRGGSRRSARSCTSCSRAAALTRAPATTSSPTAGTPSRSPRTSTSATRSSCRTWSSCGRRAWTSGRRGRPCTSASTGAWWRRSPRRSPSTTPTTRTCPSSAAPSRRTTAGRDGPRRGTSAASRSATAPSSASSTRTWRGSRGPGSTTALSSAPSAGTPRRAPRDPRMPWPRLPCSAPLTCCVPGHQPSAIRPDRAGPLPVLD